MPFFTSKNALNQDEKGHSPQTYVFYFLFQPPIRVTAMSTSPHASTLCPMFANHFILHAHVAAISTSPLPATSLLTDSQHTAGKRIPLNAPEPGRKTGALSKPMHSTFLFRPPIGVAAISLPDIIQPLHLARQVFESICRTSTTNSEQTPGLP